jgi:antitoxin component YwqK of YwqJK toxin-antitoxin module
MPSDGDYSILAFTDDGFLFFNSVPNDRFISKTVIRDDSVNNLGGFSFDTVDFNLTRNLNTTFDITEVEYLTDENGKPYHTVSNSEFNEPKIEIKEKENVAEEKPVEGISADAVFDVGGEKYSYYGFLDEENRRNGYGRTVTPGGNTAYEGFYQNDKRNGFGTFYYKNRKVNYIGNWHDNFRDGFGVGFRSSDGTSHIGKWNKNNPDGIGARFDSDGNFIFLGYYQNGKKQGKGITLDDDGSFVVSEFKDDEVITSYKIDDLLNNQNKTE